MPSFRWPAAVALLASLACAGEPPEPPPAPTRVVPTILVGAEVEAGLAEPVSGDLSGWIVATCPGFGADGGVQAERARGSDDAITGKWSLSGDTLEITGTFSEKARPYSEVLRGVRAWSAPSGAWLSGSNEDGALLVHCRAPTSIVDHESWAVRVIDAGAGPEATRAAGMKVAECAGFDCPAFVAPGPPARAPRQGIEVMYKDFQDRADADIVRKLAAKPEALSTLRGFPESTLAVTVAVGPEVLLSAGADVLAEPVALDAIVEEPCRALLPDGTLRGTVEGGYGDFTRLDGRWTLEGDVLHLEGEIGGSRYIGSGETEPRQGTEDVRLRGVSAWRVAGGAATGPWRAFVTGVQVGGTCDGCPRVMACTGVNHDSHEVSGLAGDDWIGAFDEGFALVTDAGGGREAVLAAARKIAGSGRPLEDLPLLDGGPAAAGSGVTVTWRSAADQEVAKQVAALLGAPEPLETPDASVPIGVAIGR